MIIYEDGNIQLYLDTTNEVLHVTCPDINGEDWIYIHKIFAYVVDAIERYKIEKMLFDTRSSRADITLADYKIILDGFIQSMMPTPLRKIARVSSADPAREGVIKQYVQEIGKQLPLPFEVRIFPDKATAISWLTGFCSSPASNSA